MSLYFILKMAGDLSLLYAAANAFFCMTSCDVSFLPLLVLSCCGGLLHRSNPSAHFHP